MSLYSENRVESFSGLHPAFLYVSREIRENISEIFHALQLTHGKASWTVTKHPVAGEVVAEPSVWLRRGYSASAHPSFLPGCRSRDWRSHVLLPGPDQEKRLNVVPSGPPNHPRWLRDEESL